MCIILISIGLVVVLILVLVPLVNTVSTTRDSFAFEMNPPSDGVQTVPAWAHCGPAGSSGNATLYFTWRTLDGGHLARFTHLVILGVNQSSVIYNDTNASSGGFSFYSIDVCTDPLEYLVGSSTPETVTISGYVSYQTTQLLPLL